MTLFAWLRKRFRAAPKQASSKPAVTEAQFNALNDRYRELKLKYDAAQTTEDNRRHWKNADGLSAAAANAAGTRRTLRNRSRYEYDNGAYCNGIIRTRADDLVGSNGPTLQILSDDDDLNDLIEESFATWAIATRLAEKLHTMDQSRCRDGEAFALLVTNKRLNHPVKLDLKLVEPELVADPSGMDFPEEGKIDGVEYDELGEPIAYQVLKQHPGDSLAPSPIPAERVLARFVLHWFRRDRPGQVRGVPELTSALPLFPYSRRWTLATLGAAEYAASQAGVLETDGPVDPDVATKSRELVPFEFERNMFTELPAGYKLKQLQAEHPNQSYADFKREICNEQGRPVRMPSNVVSADSSRHNFASAKLDHFGYRGGIKVDRGFAGINLLNQVFTEFVREATLVKLFPKGIDVLALKRFWLWPGWPSMDKDQAAQDDVRLKNGTLTLPQYWAEQGVPDKLVYALAARSKRLQQKYGVAFEGTTPPPEPDEPDDPDDEPDPNEPDDEQEKAKAANRSAVHLNGASGSG